MGEIGSRYADEGARRSALAGRHFRRLSLTTSLAGISVKARLRSRWTLADSGECCNTLSIRGIGHSSGMRSALRDEVRARLLDGKMSSLSI
jgi:hypothetical protein